MSRPTAAESHEGYLSGQHAHIDPLTPEVKRQLHAAVERAAGKRGERADLLLKGLSCSDAMPLEFLAWYRDREHAAKCDRDDGGCPVGPGSGDRWDGVPMSTAQRIAVEARAIVRWLMRDPVGVIRRMDETGLTSGD